ncbi:innexin inx2-like [Contarinia nasturtii]|uniref:innexin inx2-like n=1 Tax=Contarinia nasturtii TaxID=265458 RepID=UPI0012D4550F|nr:innexin inx2-like [Contarinia nasturtii]
MLSVFHPVKKLLKRAPVCVDNTLFRLHYNYTFIILTIFSLLSTSYQYFGRPIQCIVDNPSLAGVIETYCWISTTFTIPSRMTGVVGRDLIQPGVMGHIEGEDAVKHHKYYQWVPFALCFQAMLFYIPRHLWKTWEGGRIKMLATDLIMPTEEKDKRMKMLITYFQDNLLRNNFYALKFYICELLNFVNVIAQIYFMEYFLDGQFSTYGIDVLQFMEMESEIRDDPLSRVFPKMTKCTFHQYGPSGSVQKFDSMCVLPLNVINEKIFIFLWFWFLMLFILNVLWLLYRTLVVFYPTLRLYLLRCRARTSSSQDIGYICKKCLIGDWFLLYQLSKNIDPLIFKEFIIELANHLSGKHNV